MSKAAAVVPNGCTWLKKAATSLSQSSAFSCSEQLLFNKITKN